MSNDEKQKIIAETVLKWAVDRLHNMTSVERKYADCYKQGLTDILIYFNDKAFFEKLWSDDDKSIEEMKSISEIAKTLMHPSIKHIVDGLMSDECSDIEKLKFEIFRKYMLIDSRISRTRRNNQHAIPFQEIINKLYNSPYLNNNSLVTTLSRYVKCLDKIDQNELEKIILKELNEKFWF